MTLNFGDIVDLQVKPIIADMGYETLKSGTSGVDVNWNPIRALWKSKIISLMLKMLGDFNDFSF